MMTSTFRSALLAVAVAFTSLAGNLQAQTSQPVVVKIPFDFQDGAKTLPAGVYTITQANDHVLRINGKTDGGLMMMNSESDGGQTANVGKVVFHVYGDKYFLREIWKQGQSVHVACVKTSAESKAQKAAMQQSASNGKPATTIEVAVLEPAR